MRASWHRRGPGAVGRTRRLRCLSSRLRRRASAKTSSSSSSRSSASRIRFITERCTAESDARGHRAGRPAHRGQFTRAASNRCRSWRRRSSSVTIEASIRAGMRSGHGVTASSLVGVRKPSLMRPITHVNYSPAMGRKVDVDDLLDVHAVAEFLGLSQRNAVSVYRRRYPDFPAPIVDFGAGRLPPVASSGRRTVGEGDRAGAVAASHAATSIGPPSTASDVKYRLQRASWAPSRRSMAVLSPSGSPEYNSPSCFGSVIICSVIILTRPNSAATVQRDRPGYPSRRDELHCCQRPLRRRAPSGRRDEGRLRRALR